MSAPTIPFSSTLRGRLLSGGTWALAARIGTALITMVVNGLLARLLSPDEMGVYFLTITLVNITSLIGLLGLNEACVRFIAESIGMGQPQRASQVIRMVLAYGTGASLLVAAAIQFGVGRWLAISVLESNLMLDVVGLVAVWTVLVALQTMTAEIFRGLQDIRLASIFNNLAKNLILLPTLLLAWVYLGSMDLSQALLFTIITFAITDTIGLVMLYNKLRGLRTAATAPLAPEDSLRIRAALPVALPFLFNRIMIFIFTQGNLWILGAFRPQDEIALYGAAVYLVTLVALPLSAIGALVPPFIAELYVQKRKEQLERILRTITALASLPSIAALLAFVLLGGPILGLVYGEFYRDAAMMLALLSLGKSVNVFTGPCEATLNMTGHQNTMMLTSVFYGIVSIVGAFFVVQHYGALGMAAVASLSEIAQNLTVLFLAKQKTGIWTYARYVALLDARTEALKLLRSRAST